MFRRALALVLHRRRAVLAAWVLLVAAAASGLPRLVVDNSVAGFFARDVEALARYRDFRRLFGRDRALRVALSGPGLWTAEGLAWVARLETELTALPGVLGAAGLYSHHRWDQPDWPPSDPRALREEAIADPLDRGAGWVSADGEVVGVLVVLWDLGPERQRQALEQVDALVAGAPPGVIASAVGLPVVERALDVEVDRFATRFFPLFVLLAAALLAAAFRDARGVLVPLAFVTACMATVLGAMGWAGARLDLVVILLVPLAFVVSLATAVHVTVRHRQLVRRGLPARAAVRAAYREKGWPVLWAGVTTAVGFGSLAVSSVPPVESLGAWAAFALVLVTAAAFSLLPALLAGTGGRAAAAADAGFEGWARHRGRAWAGWAVRRRRPVAVGFAAATTVALAGLGGLRLDTGVLDFLRPTHPVRSAAEGLEAAGVGTAAAELVLRGGPGSGVPPFDSPGALRRLARLTTALRAEPLVLTAVGPGELVTGALDSGREMEHPADDAELCFHLALLRQVPETAPLIGSVLTAGGDAARLSLGLPMLGFDRLGAVFAAAEGRAREAFPGAEVYVTGEYPLVLDAQRGVLRTLSLSLVLTLAVVMAALGLLLGGGRLAFAALAPNLFPVAFVLGAMGWLGLPLDGSTVMIAAAVLGLAVDDTLHAMGAVRRQGGRLPPAEAAVAALHRTAPGHLLTTGLLASGFAVCALSPLVPVARFGALTALALVAALAADLLLVPALVAGVPAGALARLAGRPDRPGVRPPGGGAR